MIWLICFSLSPISFSLSLLALVDSFNESDNSFSLDFKALFYSESSSIFFRCDWISASFLERRSLYSSSACSPRFSSNLIYSCLLLTAFSSELIVYLLLLTTYSRLSSCLIEPFRDSFNSLLSLLREAWSLLKFYSSAYLLVSFWRRSLAYRVFMASSYSVSYSLRRVLRSSSFRALLSFAKEVFSSLWAKISNLSYSVAS